MNETNDIMRDTSFDTVMLGNCPKCTLWKGVRLYVSQLDNVAIRCNECGRTLIGDTREDLRDLIEAWNRAE